MMFFMLACATNGSDDIHHPGEPCTGIGDEGLYGWTYNEDLECEKNDGMEGFATCEALASSYGETVWVRTGTSVYSVLTIEFDNDDNPMVRLASTPFLRHFFSLGSLN